MFLNLLNNNEKKAFLKLAHYLSQVDADYSKKEKALIEQYCNEMQIKDIEFDYDKFDIYEVLSEFQTKQSQRIVLLEIMGLIYADEYMHEKERDVLEKITDYFQINPNLLVLYSNYAKTLISLYVQGQALIQL